MNEERFKKHMRDRFIRNLGHMQKLIDLNAPDPILALQFRLMLDSATGFMGKDLANEILTAQLSNLRQRSAFCQYCDSEVAIALSHPPICEQCDARMEKQCADMDKEIE